MVGSKKEVKQSKKPIERSVVRTNNPDSFYKMNPSWRFNRCDDVSWAFNQEHTGNYFWEIIFPYLKNLESKSWQEILVNDKKNNHLIQVSSLNTCAKNRLEEQHIEWDSLYSLRVMGTHRIYGYIIDAVFYILWYDDMHGDNNSCVCRSYKKHT